MRKLHCLLMGVLLPIGHGLLAQTPDMTAKVTDPAGSFISNVSIRFRHLFSLFRLSGRTGNTQKLIMHCQAAPGYSRDNLIKIV
jgi:hypothetical protein